METKDLRELIGDDLADRIDTLEGKATQAAQALESASGADADKIKSDIESIQGDLSTLSAERDERLREAEFKAMSGQVTSLTDAVKDLRKLASGAGYGFVGGEQSAQSGTIEGKAAEFYASEGHKHSFWNDIRGSLRGETDAINRLQEVEAEGKAMTEGTGSAGGYLVPVQISDELLQLRQQQSVIRQLVSQVQVRSDSFQIAAVTGGLTAGWVAELATKPSADLTFGQITANVFTIAGLAVASNQLLRDATHSIDTLVNADLAKRIGTVEEVGVIGGTGSGQPTGILGTSGINAVTYTSGSPTAAGILDAITDAITAIYTNFLGGPNAILMHPRTWGFLVKARESASPSTYILGSPGSNPIGRRPQDALPGYGAAATPRGELFGLPVFTSANIPTNLGAGTNESRIIVGDFSQGLLLDREGIQFDRSEHVYFTSNQTVFRAESAVGFTAARYPKAFSVIGGTGLAGN